MASKFQNRLVGTIIIVALGVIVLPGLLDGQKKHYQDEFGAIPLVPKPGEDDPTDVIPPVTQPLSETPLLPQEGANAQIPQESGNVPNQDRDSVNMTSPSNVQQGRGEVVDLKPVESKPVEQPKPVKNRWRSQSRSNRLRWLRLSPSRLKNRGAAKNCRAV